ncbi:MAG TPA: hypothetical protein VLD60_03385, partial [Nitrospira sp.]|nr:hypothetical protein [Nitrospira sp.]
EEREYLRMVRQLRIQTKKLPLPAFATMPPVAVAPADDQQARRPRPPRHGDSTNRRFHENGSGESFRRHGASSGGPRRFGR